MFSIFFYNLAISFYWLAIYLASFFHQKARLWIDGRKYWECGLSQIDLGKGKRIWFHCASLGEFEQARPLIEKWRTEKKDDLIIVTFFSPSGYEVRKNYAHADLVTYLPLDTKENAVRFIECLKPDLVLFVKYEFWFHFLTELNMKKIPVVLFSSVFRKEQIFFKWYGQLFRELLKMFSKIFVQNEESAKLLQSISVDAQVASDTRFDRVSEIALHKKSFPLIEKFKGNSKIFIAGSTWKKDEELLLQLIQENILPDYKFIIAPHQIDLKSILELQENLKTPSLLFSELNEQNSADTQIIFVDHIGSLASLYAYAEIAYIGGGFNTSVHNVLEAAVFGMPVLFGPNYKKSEEAKWLVDNKAAFSIAGYNDLKKSISYLLSSENNFATAQTNSKNYVASHIGGTEIIFRYASDLLK